MNGPELYAVLQEKGIQRLYHANSVITSATFLRERGLVSRGTAEANQWPQTPQYTDDIDRKYGIWNDVFLDSDDYHRRIGNRNQYGPVVFVMDPSVLNELPAQSQVFVTRSNPTKWSDGQSHGERYYSTLDQLRAELVRGTFDQMLTIRIPGGVLTFAQRLLEVVLDNPARLRRDGSDAFETSMRELKAATAQGGVNAPIRGRTCNEGCKCLPGYQANWDRLQGYF